MSLGSDATDGDFFFFLTWVRVQCPRKSRRRRYCASSYSWLALISWGHYRCSQSQLQELYTWPVGLRMKKVIRSEVIHTKSHCWSLGNHRETRFSQKAAVPKDKICTSVDIPQYADNPKIFLNDTTPHPSSAIKESNPFWAVWETQG